MIDAESNLAWPTESSSKCFFHQMPVTKLVCLFMYVKNVVKVGMVEIMMDKTGIQTWAPSSSIPIELSGSGIQTVLTITQSCIILYS